MRMRKRPRMRKRAKRQSPTSTLGGRVRRVRKMVVRVLMETRPAPYDSSLAHFAGGSWMVPHLRITSRLTTPLHPLTRAYPRRHLPNPPPPTTIVLWVP